MANIPVERTSGTPWWLWLLGLLLIGGLIWLVAELFDNEPDADEIAGTEDNVGVIDDVEIGDDDMDATGALTSLAMLADADAVVGRPVDLDDIRVSGLAGDSSFFVSQPGTDRRALVVLEDLGEWRSGPGDGSDGAYDINVGNTLDIEGEVVRYREGAPGTSQLAGADRDRVLRDGVYIRADDIEKDTQ